MERRLLSLDEMEIRVKFDAARARYVSIYGESVFEKCKSCNGTGLFLEGRPDSRGVWDCNSYCSDCDGFGGKFILGEIIFECTVCKNEHLSERIHCKKCLGSGYIDWIENITNKRTRAPSWIDDHYMRPY